MATSSSSLCRALAWAALFAAVASGSLAKNHADLFLRTLPAHVNVDVLPAETEACLALIRTPEQYSDQDFYYKAAHIFFKYAQQARRQLGTPDGVAIEPGAQCAAVSEAQAFAAAIVTDLVAFSRRLVVRYSQQKGGENSETDPIPTVLLKGDLLMWQQASNFLVFFDRALFWLPAHTKFADQYNEIVVRLIVFMVDCAPFLVARLHADQYGMKPPEGWLWLDLYRNLEQLHIDLESHVLGHQVRSVFQYYEAAFYRSPVHDQNLFRAMQRMLVDSLRRQYDVPAPDDATTYFDARSGDESEPGPSDQVASKNDHVIDIPSTSSGALQPAQRSHWWARDVINDPQRVFKTCDGVEMDLGGYYQGRAYDPTCPACLEYADPNYYKWKAKFLDGYVASNDDRGPGETGDVRGYTVSFREGGAVLTEFPHIEPAYPCFGCVKFTHLTCNLHRGQGELPQRCHGCRQYGHVGKPFKPSDAFNKCVAELSA